MATISEDYCSKEIYRLLIEKGFDGEVHTTFDEEGYTQASITLQMAMKWLREIYSLEIYPYHDFPKVGDKWWFEIIKYPNSVSEYESETEYNSSEEACEAAIKYCLENLI